MLLFFSEGRERGNFFGTFGRFFSSAVLILQLEIAFFYQSRPALSTYHSLVSVFSSHSLGTPHRDERSRSLSTAKLVQCSLRWSNAELGRIQGVRARRRGNSNLLIIVGFEFVCEEVQGVPSAVARVAARLARPGDGHGGRHAPPPCLKGPGQACGRYGCGFEDYGRALTGYVLKYTRIKPLKRTQTPPSASQVPQMP
uniref:Uncharacterized protein n=1 Tax=Bursaphelenchus xylophilus TaxID=6326 RepID=A0A1I7S6T7_BURXY